MQESETIFTETVNYYDRSRASISLLGCFNVRDKDGNDITSNFTPRLKHLLILLILYTEKMRKVFWLPKQQRYYGLKKKKPPPVITAT